MQEHKALGGLQFMLAKFPKRLDEFVAEFWSELRQGSLEALVRAAAVGRLYELQEPHLRLHQLAEPLLRIEMPLVRVLCDMERTGICMDHNLYVQTKQPLERRLREVGAGALVSAVSESLAPRGGLGLSAACPACSWTRRSTTRPASLWT